MRPARPARALAAVAAATALLGLCGCAAGKAAATMHEHTTIDAVNGDVGDLSLRAVAIEAPSAGGSLALDMVLINSGTQADELTGVDVEGLGGTLATSPSPLDVGAGATVRTGGSATGGAGTGGRAALTGTGGTVLPGQTYRTTFTFRRAGAITLNVPVVLPAGSSPAAG